MSLRLRMFLFIAGFFLVIFLVTQFAESYITQKYVGIAKGSMLEKIRVQNRYKQKASEKYLLNSLGYQQAQTNALLERILQQQWLREHYGPTEANYEYNTWLSAAMLLGTNKRLDFIQNTNEGKLTSLIVLDQPPPRLARKIPYSKEIPLFAMESEVYQGQWEGPFVGIMFDLDKEYEGKLPLMRDPTLYPRTNVGHYLLYSVDTVMNIDLDAMKAKFDAVQPELIKLQIDINDMVALHKMLTRVHDGLLEARNYFNEHPQLLKEVTSDDRYLWVKKNIPNFETVQAYDIERSAQESEYDLAKTRYGQIEMIWQYAIFIASGIFDYDPFDQSAPYGICHVHLGSDAGKMLIKEDIFLSNPIGCVLDPCHTKIKGQDGLGEIETYYEENEKRLFFGNTIEFEMPSEKDAKKIRKGNLTIGIDASYSVQNLALATHRMAFFSSNGHILKGYDNEGKEISQMYHLIPLQDILPNKTGIITLSDGVKYFYLNMQPFPKQEFYFFLLNPLDDEFALIYGIDESAKKMFKDIAMQTHIIIIVALLLIIIMAHFISKHITKPILILSQATDKVKEGKLNEIALTPIKKKTKDEVEGLYQAFYQMVEDLKEKEKVKGVLNKVVSPMIAEEILKGNVQLGGEEKIVTVLFADIRHFSEISEKMLPNQVIDLLNACMTKISRVIDEYGGVIDKYVGDEVMALFGAPIAREDSAVKSIECAIDMIKVINEWNEERKHNGDERRIEMGIGIHTGVVVAGNMGAENRLNYTVLGANVNLASRLCTNATEQQILISKDTLGQPFVKEKIDCEELQPIMLKGFSDPIAIYAVKGKKG